MAQEDQVARRARRLARCYPPAWRDRYGDEFVELLVADIGERPRSWRRTADVLFSSAVARVGATGLTSGGVDRSDPVLAGLVAFGCACAVFLMFGVALWSQLTIGWQWSAPGVPAVTVGMVMMSGAVMLLLALGALAAVPVIWSVLRAAAGGVAGGLLRPGFLVLAGGAAFVIGSRHFANGWPGTGAHSWTHQGLVPGGLAAFGWAATMAVSSYWAHPGTLATFPVTEVGWMVASPVAMVGLIVGLVKIVRRVDMSPHLLHCEVMLGRVAGAAMLVFLGGAASWVIDGARGPRGLFHAGVIDAAGLTIMTFALVVALRAVARCTGSVCRSQ